MNEMSALFDALVFRLGWMLVHSIWEISAVAGILAGVLHIGKSRLSSAARYAISYAAMLLALAAVAFTATRIDLPAPALRSRTGQRIIEENERSGRVTGVSPVLEASGTGETRVTRSIWPVLSIIPLSERALPWLVGAWALGVVLLSAWQLGGWLILQRWRNSAQSVDHQMQQRMDQLAWKMAVQRVLVRLCNHVDVPVVLGFWRPIILVPLSILNDLPPAQLEAILAHELAHVRRCDYLANLIHVAIETVLFYHPAIWWMSRQIRLERECCCDELAASACADRTEYVKALTMLETTRGPRLAPAITGRGGRGELLTRVRRLLGASDNSARSARFEMRSWITSALLLSVLLGITAGGRILQAQQEPAAPSTQPIPFRVSVLEPEPFAAQPAGTSVTPEDLVPGPVEDYKISRNDLIQVNVSDGQQVNTQKVSRISESGMISLPYIGQVKAEGLSDAQLEQAIGDAFRAKQILDRPQVTVSLLEARGRTFTIAGAIARPSQYQINDSRMTLLEALAIAGGPEKKASVTVHRHIGGAGDVRLIEIPAAAVTTGDPKFNIIIRPLDYINVIAPQASVESPADAQAEQEAKILTEQLVQAKIALIQAEATLSLDNPTVKTANEKVEIIQKMLADVEQRLAKASTQLNEAEQRLNNAVNQVVPLWVQESQAGEYYIGGDIQRGGVYSLKARQVTLRQAIISAGLPAMDRPYYAEIIRRNGNQQEIVVRDLSVQDIFDGKQPDIFLKPDDQIMVRDAPHTQMPTTLPAIQSNANPFPAAPLEQDRTVELNAQAYAWDVLQQRQQNGEALTPTFVQLLLDTSERLAEAQSEAAVAWPQRVAAVEGHLDRVVQLADIVRKRQRQDTGRVQMSQCNAVIESVRATIIRMKASALDAGEPQ